MPFDNEDLKRLKDRMTFVGGEKELFGPLLARLEAAENCIGTQHLEPQASLNEKPMKVTGDIFCPACEAEEAWRKAARK